MISARALPSPLATTLFLAMVAGCASGAPATSAPPTVPSDPPVASAPVTTAAVPAASVSPAPDTTPVVSGASADVPPSGTGTSTTVRTHEPSAPGEAAKHLDDCNKGVASACHAAALDAYYQPSAASTDRAAFDRFKKACDAGYAPSCNGLGLMHAEGRGVKKDPVRAAELYRDACVGGGSTGCQQYADVLTRGVGVAKDKAAADRATVRGKCILEASNKPAKLAACPAL